VAKAEAWWGWHQLDAQWSQRLVDGSGVGAGDWVIDVGAGHGALTAPLLARGAHVIAVEQHPVRAQRLRDRFGRDVVVVQADARELRLPRRPFHVVANPPFAITTELLKLLLQRGSRLQSAHLVVPRAAAQRWSGPGAPAAARWSKDFQAQLGARVPRHAFRPPPSADARVLVLARREVLRDR
jgi:23S rRNA (adenine-N6)-dimethyltransferase